MTALDDHDDPYFPSQWSFWLNLGFTPTHWWKRQLMVSRNQNSINWHKQILICWWSIPALAEDGPLLPHWLCENNIVASWLINLTSKEFTSNVIYFIISTNIWSQGLFICVFNSASILCTNNTNVASIPTNNVITDQGTLINNVDADLWTLG
jgi:hypothetical protein